MAGIIGSFIRIVTGVEGAKETSNRIRGIANSTDQVTKAQTRLGQASASAGKQFSSQASGLGGLVSAYAGAAATIFSVQQAFAALQRVAESEQIIQGTKTLAAEFGQSGDSIIRKMQEITKTQITMTEAAQNANIALAAGFNADQIERLTEVSFKASRALGRNMTDALQRVVRGTAKLEPELLDELGIFTRIDPAMEKYAQNLNRSTASLTDFEKRQAFVTAAIEEGERKFKNINTTISSSQETLESLAVEVLQLGIVFGQVLLESLTPFLEFFTDNVGNAILAFAVLTRAVLGKAFDVLGQKIEESLTRFKLFVDRLANMSLEGSKTTKIFEGLAEAVNEAQLTAGRGQITARQGPARQAVTALRTGDLTATQAIENVRILETLKQQNEAELKNLQFKRQQNEAIGRGIKGIDTQIDRITLQNQKLNQFLKTANVQVAELNTRTVRVAENIKNWVTGATAFTLGLVRVATQFISIFSIAVALSQIIGQVFGVDILGTFFENLRKSREEAKQLKRTFEEFVGLFPILPPASVAPEGIEKFAKEVRELVVEQFEAADSSAIIARRFEEIEQSTSQADTRTQEFAERYREAGTSAVTFSEKLELVRSNLRSMAASGDEAAATALELVDRFEEISLSRLINELSILGDVSATSLKRLVDSSSLAINTLGNVSLTFGELQRTSNGLVRNLNDLSITIGRIDEEGRLTLPEILRDTIASLTAAATTTEEFFQSFNEGSLNAEESSRNRIKLENQLIKAREALRNETTSAQSIEAIGLQRIIDFLERQLELVSDLSEEIILLEKLNEDINKQYSSQINLVDKLITQGQFGLFTGEFAKNQNEELANQSLLLRNIIEEGKAINENLDASNVKQADQIKKIQNANTAIKAQFGSVIQLAQQIEDLTKKEEKRAVELNGQNEILKAQLQLVRQQAEQTIREAQQERIVAVEEKRNVLLEQRDSLFNVLEERQVKQIEHQKELLSIEQDRLSLQRDLATGDIEKRIELLQRELDIQTAQLQLDFQRQDQARIFSGVTQEETARREEELLNLEFSTQLKILAERRKLLQEEFAFDVRENELKRKQLDKELELINKRENQARNSARIEIENIQRENNLAKQRIQNELTNLNAQRNILDTQKEIQNAEIDARKAAITNEFDLLEKEISLIKLQAEVFSAFTEDFENILVRFVQDFAKIQQFTGPLATEEQARQAVRDIPLDTSGLESQVAANRRRALENLELQRTAAVEGLIGQQLAIDEQIEGQRRLLELQEEISSGRIRLTEQERESTIAELQNERRVITEKLGLNDLEREKIEALFNRKFEDLNKEEQLTLVNAALRAEQLAEEQKLFKNLGRVIAEDLKGAIEDFLNEIFIGTKSLSDSIRDLFTGVLEALIQRITEKLIIEQAASLFDAGLGFIFGAGGGLIKKFASGGIARFAAGGVSVRDSQPALLEPGEFVVKKRSVDNIGLNNLRMMNATGQMNQNATVNIINNGTPQKTTQPPKINFDGRKFVIDVVLEDLRNNGPVRQNLKGLRQ